MKRSFAKKLIPLFILVTLLSSEVFLPLSATADNEFLNYDNPNVGGNNPYKPSLDNILTSGLLTSLVGCTGIVNKVSKTTTDFAKKLLLTKKEKAELKAAKARLKTTNVPSVDGLTAEEIEKAKTKAADDAAAVAFREECLNGIAVTLAKNQLASFTKYTMNWVTTGFNGDPFFVRNVDQFMDSITQDLLKKEAEFFKNPANAAAYPYGRIYAQNQIDSYKSSRDVYGSLKQDLTNYLAVGATPESFANDFSEGGWDGWLALTQHDQNNPVGFTMVATQNLSGAQLNATTNTKEELAQNGGFLSQKKCADPKDYDSKNPQKNVCKTWETVTPGSIIKDKVSTYVNSPERQTELVRTINDALNALFSSLIMKFENQGLSSLGSQRNNFTGFSGGLGSNQIFDTAGNVISGSGSNGGGASGNTNSFDITRNLGNQYVNATNEGNWNAKTNTPALLPNTGTKNHFYTVNVSGSTKLFDGNYVWQTGDKAYFDGTEWRVGVPKYAIATKGVLQIQSDYIAKVKDAMNASDDVVSAIARLDYCIPGPNSSWQANSSDELESFIGAETDDGDISELFDEYEQKIQDLYGPTSPMQTSGSSGYLAMSQSGLSLTKDLESYSEIMNDKKTEYQDDIATTNSNIDKLNELKNKVNVIIAAAQARRDTKRVQAGQPKVTALCLATEKVTYVENDVLK